MDNLKNLELVDQKRGQICPHCGTLLKTYSRRLNSTMAKGLIKLFIATNKNSGKTFFHLHSDLNFSKVQAADFAKLRYWNMIEEAKKEDMEDKRTSGKWRITETGVAFVLGKIHVPEVAKVYRAELKELDGNKINIFDALKNKFSYQQLMSE